MEDDINLYQLVKFYAKKWLWFVVITVLAGVAGFAYSNYLQTPLYKSEATMLVLDKQSQSGTQSTTLINNYIALITSRRVLDPVLKDNPYHITYDDLVAATSTRNDKNTEVIGLSVSTDSADKSHQLAAGIVDSFGSLAKDLYGNADINIVDQANTPDRPYNIQVPLTTLLVAAAGFIVTTISLFFVYDFTRNMPEKPKPAPAKQKPLKSAKKVAKKRQEGKRRFAFFRTALHRIIPSRKKPSSPSRQRPKAPKPAKRVAARAVAAATPKKPAKRPASPSRTTKKK